MGGVHGEQVDDGDDLTVGLVRGAVLVVGKGVKMIDISPSLLSRL